MFITIVAALFGLATGSFLALCIYRIPRSRSDFPELLLPIDGSPPEGDVVAPTLHKVVRIHDPARSFCPHCEQILRWWHNIPLLSWFLLRGRCAFCKTPISARYPFVEFLGGLAAVLSVQAYGVTPTGLVVFVFCCALIVISFIDYDFYIIPDVISKPFMAIGVVIAAVNQFFQVFDHPVVPDLTQSLLGLLMGAGFLYIVSEVYERLRKKNGLGLGDVKLLAMTGLMFGAPAALCSIFIGSLLGAVFGSLFLLLGGKRFSHPIPFGPYLALATAVYLFAGDTIVASLSPAYAALRIYLV